jgi:cyclopropane fatty-acyl-phospholipid synthase-like methyltransferase
MASVVRSLRRSASITQTWFSMWRADPSTRAKRMYEMYLPDKLPTDTTGYMNMGYWTDGCDSLDQAGENLAELLATEGDFTAGDRILDAGCGFGDQDFHWLRTRDPAKIVALNVTPAHVAHARARAERDGVTDRLEFRRHSATELDYPDGSFDRVVAMESGFHFDTRQDFFAQAVRVLRTGGVFTAVDLLPLQDVEGEVPDNPTGRSMGPFPVKFPPENWHPAETYREHLLKAGFATATVRSIRELVYDPWLAHMRALVETPEFRKKFGVAAKVMAREFGKPALKENLARMDYVVAVAGK